MRLITLKILLLITVFSYGQKMPLGMLVSSQAKQGDAYYIDPNLSFFNAYGYGRFTTGGRGGTQINVDNLNASGTGSFREAMETSGAREITFYGTSGVIDLGGTSINAGAGNVSILGQTSPGGIFIYGGELEFNNVSNILIEHLRIRPGDQTIGSNDDALRIINPSNTTAQENFMIANCSIGWGDDENVGLGGSESNNAPLGKVTIQNCILHEPFEGLKNVLFGAGMYDVSFVKNLFSNGSERNPRSAYGDVNFEVINNAIVGNNQAPISFTWSNKGDIIGNVHKRVGSPASSRTIEFTQSHDNAVDAGLSDYPIEDSRAYINDNTVDGGDADSNYVGSLGPYIEGSRININSGTPIQANGPLMIADLLEHAGAYLNRDAIDQGQIDDFVNGTGALVATETAAGFATLPTYSGTAPTDADADGIADDFETEHGITDPSAVKDVWYFNGQKYNNGGLDNLHIYWQYLGGRFE